MSDPIPAIRKRCERNYENLSGTPRGWMLADIDTLLAQVDASAAQLAEVTELQRKTVLARDATERLWGEDHDRLSAQLEAAEAQCAAMKEQLTHQHQTLTRAEAEIDRLTALCAAKDARIAALEQAQDWQPVNVNDYVRVRVRQKGFEILRRSDEIWNSRVSTLRFDQATRVQREQEENGGWSKWQLWSLMETFGHHIGLGCDMPFETTIEVSGADERTPQAVTKPPESGGLGADERKAP